ncbi:MAG TPA: hypothetical protein VGS11_05220 [Candidatus Bathyarchaeia archaeon]|nr:hypothetical protein [Candidatus Bathyarchaeia archaeon]
MSTNEIKAKSRALLLSMTILLAGGAFLAQSTAATSFNNVQVFVSSSSSPPNGFQFAAYNLTGNLIASYQSSYPAAAFELPSGGYLFTVSSTSFNPLMKYPCPIMAAGATQGAGSASPAIRSNGSAGSAVMPIACYPQSSEYGYAITSISSSQTVNIEMKNVSALPTTDVTVKVAYVNGTAAADASVYASVVGEYYGWWQNSAIRMGAQTDSNGVAHLVLPSAPAVVTAWKWVSIPIPEGQKTIQTTVGGEKVNVTVYWQPTYVGLSGSGLLLPPQSSISLTLRYQQPDYWVMPMGVASKDAYVGGAPSATVANQPNGMPSLVAQGSSQNYLPSQIPAFQASGVSSPSGSQAGLFGVDAATIAFALLAVVVVGTAIVVARHRISKPSTPTG